MVRRAVAIDAWPVMMSTSVVGNDALIERRRSSLETSGSWMCKEIAADDPEIKALCERIKVSQQAEIDQMKAKLRALDG